MGWREQYEGLVFATHDLVLSAAARASGLEVMTVPSRLPVSAGGERQ